MTILKKTIALVLALAMIFQLTACGIKETAKNAANKVADGATTAKDYVVDGVLSAKDAVVKWYDGIDLNKFEDGWNSAIAYMGTAYSAAMSSEYVASVGVAINNLKVQMNSATGSARGIAQEAGYAAEKWAAGTFNIDSVVRSSSYKAEVVGSNDLGSVDVTTNYGENASLKYYQSANDSAQAQAKSLIDAYRKYYSQATRNGAKEPMSLQEYMDSHGFVRDSQKDLLASIYEGQTRIIPTDQLSEATAYLEGRITKLSAIDGDVASARTQAYQETLNNLKDRLVAPDGTQSKPATYEEMQAIAELSQAGEFKPEDFGITLSQSISPKYVMKQAMGTGLEVGLLRTVFTVGPDFVTILVDAVKNGGLDEEAIKNTSIESAIAFSEGFVEGSLSRVVVTLCQEGVLGEALKSASPEVVGALVFLTIEAIISGYSLAKDEITAEEYGCLMADKVLITTVAIPTTVGLLSILPGTKLFMLAGCFAGGMIASTGYIIAKTTVMEFIDGGGFEAIIPTNLSSGIANGVSNAKKIISNMAISGHLSNLKDFTVTTANDGLILVKGIFN